MTSVWLLSVVLALLFGSLIWGGSTHMRLEAKARRDREDEADRSARALVASRAHIAINAVSALREFAEDDYLRASNVQAWRQTVPDPEGLLISAQDQELISVHELATAYGSAHRILMDVGAWVEQRNEEYVAGRLSDIGSWADERLEHPLTEKQRRAIVVDEDCNLVVAAAGTGKTSTILAKVAYLIEHRDVQPRDVLVLAFNKTVAQEITHRLESLGLSGVEVSTFHAKGYEILGRSSGRKPAISRLAEDRLALLRFLQARFERLVTDRSFFRNFSRWWVDLRVQVDDFRDCKTPDERLRREKSVGLRTLDGTWVRSQSEVKVADWLTLNGFRWVHEATYPHSPSSKYRRDYTPDFFLPEHGVWIEVWACDTAEQRFPPEVDAMRYREGMAWKRDLHREHETHLLEISQTDIWKGGLSRVIEERLAVRGVRPRPLSADDVHELLIGRDDRFSTFVQLVGAFLSLFRAGAWSKKAVTRRAITQRDREFLQLFWPFLEAYHAALSEEAKIDFDEMLLTAGRELADQQGRGAYRYILVDEFQDSSRARLNLLKGLRGKEGAARLFLVGDDWQSIYRFAGADLGFFTDVASHLGPTARTDLDQTFRLVSDIANLSSTFVMRNPAQLEKELKPREESVSDPAVSIRFHTREAEPAALSSALTDITHRAGNSSNVLVLGRYNHTLEVVKALSAGGPQVSLEPLTVHRSKGLESDHVIILGLEDGVFGFPSELVDDRVLRLVMSQPDTHHNAEERRLFYVALTRTRGRVYLLADSNNPSAFVQELLQDDFRDWIEVIGEESKRYRCPKCAGKTVKRWEGRADVFWGCINYAACRGRLPICPSCESGVLQGKMQAGKISAFACTECSHRAECCPRCGSGALVAKQGSSGPFLGCSSWRRDGQGCDYTRDAK